MLLINIWKKLFFEIFSEIMVSPPLKVLCLCDWLLKKYYVIGYLKNITHGTFSFKASACYRKYASDDIYSPLFYIVVWVWGRGAGKFQFLEKYTTHFKSRFVLQIFWERQGDRESNRSKLIINNLKKKNRVKRNCKIFFCWF